MDGMGWDGRWNPSCNCTYASCLPAMYLQQGIYIIYLCETLALTFRPSAGQETLTLISTKPTLFCRNPLRFHGST